MSHWILGEIGCLVTLAGKGEYKRGAGMAEAGVFENAWIEFKEGRVARVGLHAESTPPIGIPLTSARGATVLPGFVDSHTHAIFQGFRDDEFEKRAAGVPYMEIMKAGGGILKSVGFVRAATEATLKETLRERLKIFWRHGTTTLEVKSGYGLDRDTELKCLRVIRDLNGEEGVDLVPTFMGAHAVPPEFKGRPADYLEFQAREVLPVVKSEGLAGFCDIFCEKNVFELPESRRFLEKARDLGFKLRMHADEIVSLGGAELACELGCASADHLLQVSEQGIAALAKSPVTLACLLPGTSFTLREKFAPARALLQAGAALGLATDCNPGSSFTENMQCILNLACNLLKMGMGECLNAAIYNNAVSLGRINQVGSLEPGKRADFALYDVPNYRHLFYHYGLNHCIATYKNGRRLWP